MARTVNCSVLLNERQNYRRFFLQAFGAAVRLQAGAQVNCFLPARGRYIKQQRRQWCSANLKNIPSPSLHLPSHGPSLLIASHGPRYAVAVGLHCVCGFFVHIFTTHSATKKKQTILAQKGQSSVGLPWPPFPQQQHSSS